jgi:hypothetical protein
MRKLNHLSFWYPIEGIDHDEAGAELEYVSRDWHPVFEVECGVFIHVGRDSIHKLLQIELAV